MRWALLLSSILILSCGDDGGTAADAGLDGGGTEARSFALSSTGLQAAPGNPRLYSLGEANLATDVDLVAIHQDFYGVPWDAFASGEEPPEAWADVMTRLAMDARSTGLGVFLSVALVGGPGRAFLADRARSEGGALRVDEGWSTRCFDFATDPDGPAMRSAYLRYLVWMADLFEPAYFNIALEMNLFASSCGDDAWAALVDVQNAGYAEVKAARPDTLVFPSFVLEHLYGLAAESCPAPADEETCYAEHLAQIEPLERDRFGISTYPYGEPETASVAAIPEDWFTRAAGDERIVIAETGWNSSTITAFDGTSCVPFHSSTPADQVAYFDRLVAEAERAPIDVVTWWSNRDLIPTAVMNDCPCSDDPDWCAVVDVFRTAIGGDDPAGQYVGEVVFKFWGSMGLRDYGGEPKADFYARWQEVRSRPWTP